MKMWYQSDIIQKEPFGVSKKHPGLRIFFVYELTRQTLKSFYNMSIMKHANLLKTVTNRFAIQ